MTSVKYVEGLSIKFSPRISLPLSTVYFLLVNCKPLKIYVMFRIYIPFDIGTWWVRPVYSGKPKPPNSQLQCADVVLFGIAAFLLFAFFWPEKRKAIKVKILFKESSSPGRSRLPQNKLLQDGLCIFPEYFIMMCCYFSRSHVRGITGIIHESCNRFANCKHVSFFLLIPYIRLKLRNKAHLRIFY